MSICHKIQLKIRKNLSRILALRDKRTKKDDNSYVTDADLLCERIIIDQIKALPEDFEVISEETAVVNFLYNKHKNYVIVDPIDGTENFTSGLKEWGVSVSVYKNGKHFESMLALPELNIYLHTGDIIPVFRSRIYGLSSAFTKEDMLNIPEGLEYRIIGCCVYNIYNVIIGAFAVYGNPKGAEVWDILAGLNLALEHECLVTVNGRPYGGEFLHPQQKYIFKIEKQYAR